MATNTRYRLIPPERAADAGETPLVVDVDGWPESAAAVLSWLLHHDLAVPWGTQEQLTEALCNQRPSVVARAIAGLGEPAAAVVLARLKGREFFGDDSGQHGEGGDD